MILLYRGPMEKKEILKYKYVLSIYFVTFFLCFSIHTILNSGKIQIIKLKTAYSLFESKLIFFRKKILQWTRSLEIFSMLALSLITSKLLSFRSYLYTHIHTTAHAIKRCGDGSPKWKSATCHAQHTSI